MSDFMVSFTVSVIGISLMSWWLITRISKKLSEVAERNNWDREKS
ncbi:MAG TPA: hypothetical protein QF821_00815 [Candidatus Thalassarchaeaceae archaeon]|jgi:hypothetical protein|nr:hypothetical protein [Candidatus Thalassarchaeaceae archaeon]|tara:strand:- start:1020 stop:1154 length:135 start_codon:yes stop_codon:yes gene_type:complete